MSAFRKSVLLGLRKTSYFRLSVQNACLSSHAAVATKTTNSGDCKPYEEIPGPPRLPLIGNVHLFSKLGPYSFEKLYDAYMDLHKKYGPVVRLELGMPLILLFDPEDIQTLLNLGERYPKRPLFKALRHYRLKEREGTYSSAGLIAENGEEWWRLRKAANFMMLPDFPKTYFRSHEKIADDFISRIREIKDENGQIQNFLHEIYRYTQEAIGIVCFGTRLGVLDSSNSKLSQTLTEASHDFLGALADTLLQPEYWKLFKTPTYKKLIKSHDFFHDFAVKCMKSAEMKLKEPQYKNDPNLQFLSRLLNNKNLTPSDIVLLMVEIFSSGLDTTGITIGFILYNLARNPEIQEKLHKDITENLKNGLNEESLIDMKYLKATIQESHRLNPPTGGSARILSKNATFSGYEIPSGVTCLGLHPVVSRLERHFAAPLQFSPDRWLQGVRGTCHPYCVAPFGHGVRRCVGQRFAEQETRLCIVKIIEKFRVEYDGPDVGTTMRLSLIPDKPLNFKFIER